MKKEKNFLGCHIRYWIKDNSYILKVDNIHTRDKIYEILKNKSIQYKKDVFDDSQNLSI
jgi:tRNA A22 N-methylase